MPFVITGHSRGLGAALTAHCLAHGHDVLGLSRHVLTPAALPASGQTRPGRCTGVALDLSDAAALSAWLETPVLADWLQTRPGPWVLVNNAGRVGPVARADQPVWAEQARSVALNVAAPLMLTSALLAVSRPAGAAIERRVVHLSSGAARKPYAGWSTYCATKAALDHHARSVAQDALDGVRIVSLAPGVLDTDMQATLRASDPVQFPDRPRFVSLQATGALTAPAQAAQRLFDFVLGADFGRDPLADLRDRP